MAEDDKPTIDDGTVSRRRTQMAGLWAAELLGLINQAAHDYAHDLAQGAKGGAEDEETLIHRLARDLHGKASLHEIRAKLAHLLREARRQLFHGDPPP